MQVTYIFKGNVLEPVSLNAPHIPNVGETVRFNIIEAYPEKINPRFQYGGTGQHWVVVDRLFILTVPATPTDRILCSPIQRVEIFLENTLEG